MHSFQQAECLHFRKIALALNSYCKCYIKSIPFSYSKLQVIVINKLNLNLKRGKILLTETRQFHKKGDLHIYMHKHIFYEISLAKPKSEKTFMFSSLSRCVMLAVCDAGDQ